MLKKIKSILLIDDDNFTNVINKMIIKKTDCAENTISVTSGREALNYLTSVENNEYPNLILLDINMPGMNGWEFIEKYRGIKNPQLEKSVLIILTTSSDPAEEKKANSLPEIKGFKNKPLNQKLVEDIMKEYFIDL